MARRPLDGVAYADPPPPRIEKDRFELFNSLLTERYLFATLTRTEIETIPPESRPKGANGAQYSDADTPAVDGSPAAPFNPRSKAVNDFLADGYIKDQQDAHNDVRNVTVGQLVAASIDAG